MLQEKINLRLDDLIQHISFKCGLSHSMVRRVLQDLVDYICIKFIENPANVIFIPRLGSFFIDRNKTKKAVTFASSTFLEELIFSDDPKDLSLNRLGLDREITLTPDLNLTSGDELKKKEANNRPDLVRSSFISYLQEEFAYDESWQHPITKQVYTKDQIYSAIKLYKDYAPDLYQAIRYLWVSQYNRATIANYFSVSSSSIRRIWNRAIDSILLILFYPELDPNVPIKIYNSRR